MDQPQIAWRQWLPTHRLRSLQVSRVRAGGARLRGGCGASGIAGTALLPRRS
jgi:hypothetical protein